MSFWQAVALLVVVVVTSLIFAGLVGETVVVASQKFTEGDAVNGTVILAIPWATLLLGLIAVYFVSRK